MLTRRLGGRLAYLLDHVPAVALLGPLQAGQTTLALALSGDRPSVCLELEAEAIGVVALARELQALR